MAITKNLATRGVFWYHGDIIISIHVITMEIAFLIGRILFGGFFVMSGMNHFMKTGMMTQYVASKNVPSPKLAVMASGLLLILGGLGIVVGAYVQIAVLALVLFFVPVSLKMHNFWTVTDPQQRMAEMVNFLKNMALMGAALMMLAIPTPWAFSVF